MPARKEKKAAVDITPVSIKPEFLDELVPGPMTAGDFESMFRGLKKAPEELGLETQVLRGQLRLKPQASLRLLQILRV